MKSGKKRHGSEDKMHELTDEMLNQLLQPSDRQQEKNFKQELNYLFMLIRKNKAKEFEKIRAITFMQKLGWRRLDVTRKNNL